MKFKIIRLHKTFQLSLLCTRRLVIRPIFALNYILHSGHLCSAVVHRMAERSFLAALLYFAFANTFSSNFSSMNNFFEVWAWRTFIYCDIGMNLIFFWGEWSQCTHIYFRKDTRLLRSLRMLPKSSVHSNYCYLLAIDKSSFHWKILFSTFSTKLLLLFFCAHQHWNSMSDWHSSCNLWDGRILFPVHALIKSFSISNSSCKLSWSHPHSFMVA